MGRRRARGDSRAIALMERHNLRKKVTALSNRGGRSIKNMARMIMLEKKEFSEFERQIMEENPEYKGNVSEEVHVVRAYTGFEVIDGKPLLDTEWEKTKTHLGFSNVNLPETQKSFEAAGNGHQIRDLLQFVDEHPKYLERIYNPVLEELDGKNDAEAEAQRRAILEPEEQPKGKYPKKSSGKQPRPHSRSYYHTKPVDPSIPTPITE